jgi:hypothetical protein
MTSSQAEPVLHNDRSSCGLNNYLCDRIEIRLHVMEIANFSGETSHGEEQMVWAKGCAVRIGSW